MISEHFGIELPIVQAPMAGVQGSLLAIAVSNAGGLGSLPCALLGADQIRKELQAITAATSRLREAARPTQCAVRHNIPCHTRVESNRSAIGTGSGIVQITAVRTRIVYHGRMPR